ncbi:malate dehydrogenase [Raphidocelis subcapitata]|uniref:malate dehydrogenase n=1 Tax=Raphidocelis subcapitata TaxID=307507 RepID=A0A2V0NVQ2_9CHLO|nr:malate dehydrogenase [Raphidocelis subcapitata]|eukprot:GBF91409.1 malate dehydrogenase [Raphidocelis subcapitata]
MQGLQMRRAAAAPRAFAASRAAPPVRPAAASRRRSAAVEAAKVALLGASSPVGQPLSLLLKMDGLISDLALYDVAGVAGIAADLSHCNTPIKVSSYTGPELEGALKGADLVVIAAGVPKTPGMGPNEVFTVNASIVRSLCAAVARFSPKAVVAVVTGPVNSTIPVASETLKAAGVYDPRRLLGVTTVTEVRANTFAASAARLEVSEVDVPVVCGASGPTAVPLFSLAKPPLPLSAAERAAVMQRLQRAEGEVAETPATPSGPALAVAYGAARFVESVLLGLAGEADVYETAFIEAEVVAGLPYFATRVQLGPGGIKSVVGIKELDALEEAALNAAAPQLLGDIEKGKMFVRQPAAARA